jgi:hypothetical protein
MSEIRTNTNPHPMLKFFQYKHLPERLQPVSAVFHHVAHFISDSVPRNDESDAAMRKLLEAKDAAVRAAL